MNRPQQRNERIRHTLDNRETGGEDEQGEHEGSQVRRVIARGGMASDARSDMMVDNMDQSPRSYSSVSDPSCRVAPAAASMTAPAKAMVQIGSVGKKWRMIVPITVATSNCGMTTKALNSPI